jgi:two-component system response regulator AtoC
MRNEHSIYNNFYFIDILEANELINSIRDNESVVKIGNFIHYDSIFEFINNGFGLSGVVQETTNQLEKYIIINILEHTGWNKSKTARILKINYKTLYYKMKKYSI